MVGPATMLGVAWWLEVVYIEIGISLLVLEALGHVLCFGILSQWKAVAHSSITLFGSIALFLWDCQCYLNVRNILHNIVSPT